MKEQLVSQLKTQVTDLERFIEFLQKGGGKLKMKNNSASSKYFINFLKKQNNNNDNFRRQNLKTNLDSSHPDEKSSTVNLKHKTANNNNVNKNATIASIFKRIVSLLQMFAWTQLGTGKYFKREIVNK